MGEGGRCIGSAAALVKHCNQSFLDRGIIGRQRQCGTALHRKASPEVAPVRPVPFTSYRYCISRFHTHRCTS